MPLSKTVYFSSLFRKRVYVIDQDKIYEMIWPIQSHVRKSGKMSVEAGLNTSLATVTSSLIWQHASQSCVYRFVQSDVTLGQETSFPYGSPLKPSRNVWHDEIFTVPLYKQKNSATRFISKNSLYTMYR